MASSGKTNCGMYWCVNTCVSVPVNFFTLSNSGAPGFNSSPPMDAPSSKVEPIVRLE